MNRADIIPSLERYIANKLLVFLGLHTPPIGRTLCAESLVEVEQWQHQSPRRCNLANMFVLKICRDTLGRFGRGGHVLCLKHVRLTNKCLIC